MNRYLLNVGLIESTTLAEGRSMSAAGTLEVIRDHADSLFSGGAAVVAHAVHTSDTEPTLVVEIRTSAPAMGRMGMLADLLAVRLRQDAIAVAALLPSGSVGFGRLFGPLAARWGEFNPAYFLLLNGSRAAVETEVAA